MMRLGRAATLFAVATVVAALNGVGFGAIAGASSAPAPNLAKFLPANYRVTSVLHVDLDGSGVPQEAVTAVGPVNKSGFATSLVLLLAWDSFVGRWTSVYNTLNDASWQTSSQLGKGPGLVDLTNAGPQIQVIHDHTNGGADLLYWLDSIEGNSGDLIVGIVNFQHQIATRTYTFSQSYGHIFFMDQPSHIATGATVVGNSPNQDVRISIPLLTADDSLSQGARMYYLTVANAPRTFDFYQVVYDDEAYVGVGLTTKNSAVGYIDPNSPARGILRSGDVIESVVGSSLSAKDLANLNGPKVIEEVALYHPGDVIELRVLRHGQQLLVKLKLAQWPKYQSATYIITPTGGYYLIT